MQKRILADFIQKQDRQVIVKPQTLDEMIGQLNTMTVGPKQMKPGYSNRFSKSNANLLKLIPNHHKESKINHSKHKQYESVCDSSKFASPPLTDARPPNIKINDEIQDTKSDGIKDIVKNNQNNFQSLIKLGEEMKIVRNSKIKLRLKFTISCNLNKDKISQKQQVYSVFDDSRRAFERLVGTCLQQNNTFKYTTSSHQQIYQMEFKDNIYFLKSISNTKQQTMICYFTHINQNMRFDSSQQKDRLSTKVNRKYQPKVLKTYFDFNKRKFQSKMKFNPKFRMVYIDSKSFDLSSCSASMVNTVIFDPKNKQVCAIYQKDGKIQVELNDPQLPSHMILMMAVSRIDFKRRCCIRTQ